MSQLKFEVKMWNNIPNPIIELNTRGGKQNNKIISL